MQEALAKQVRSHAEEVVRVEEMAARQLQEAESRIARVVESHANEVRQLHAEIDEAKAGGGGPSIA